jgi:ATP-binding protein involved in chromosome partitioning
LPENRYYIFGKNGCTKLAERLNMKLLGQIPIVQSICEGGDKGIPSALDATSVEGKAFVDLAQNLAEVVKKRNTEHPPTKRVILKS